MTHSRKVSAVPFDPDCLPRETARHYIGASDADIASMLETLGIHSLDDLFDHIPCEQTFDNGPHVPDELSYEAVAQRMQDLARQNREVLSFIGDGLPDCSVPSIVNHVLSVRNLTTAYTPYQPERSQGTLMTHWIYQCAMARLTGFEAINSSLYDRSTAIFEAICATIRLTRKASTVLIPKALYPGDHDVIRTLAAETDVHIEEIPLDRSTGRIDLSKFQNAVCEYAGELASVVIPQVNTLGCLEDVDALTEFAHSQKVRVIAVVDPMLLGSSGLKAPADFGTNGADFVVGEAQHLALAPNFGGPGLGVFGARFNATTKNDIRQTPGRYVGKARDLAGRHCHVMVLSTREQHIRREKATSNICSNQAYLATIVGAALLSRGDSGMESMLKIMRSRAVSAFQKLSCIPGIRPAFPETPFFNEVVIDTPQLTQEVLARARREGVHLGVSLEGRIPNADHLIKISFSDKHTVSDIDRLVEFFERNFGVSADAPGIDPAPIEGRLLRKTAPGLKAIPDAKLTVFYDRLGDLNASPDEAPYPLGSCTMKYNPHLNDWAAGLSGFAHIHPQAPIEDAQGCLEVLYQIQEWFKKITGLDAVTTQPVAGAQGELVGLKLFQAFHRAQGVDRNILFIPKSAHGTNFATAAMAGFSERTSDSMPAGIILLEADDTGQIDLADFEEKLGRFGSRLAGVMITNPNTSGIFETRFREIADKVHAAGALVYMDGANMNAIAGRVNLKALGVDAVHNNLHKTWSIPHGGGGPGDAIVAVSERLSPFLPGYQIVRDSGGIFRPVRPEKSIGSFHRHWGNFAHKVRCYTYLLRLGKAGIPRMSGVAVLASRYVHRKLQAHYQTLPCACESPRMHEFILTLRDEDFARIEAIGIPRAAIIGRIGKLFLDFGFHAPTVAWPETFGLMIEPTESYSRAELDRFAEAVIAIIELIRELPQVLLHSPVFTPVDRIDDVTANRAPVLNEQLDELPNILDNRVPSNELHGMPIASITERIKSIVQQRI